MIDTISTRMKTLLRIWSAFHLESNLVLKTSMPVCFHIFSYDSQLRVEGCEKMSNTSLGLKCKALHLQGPSPNMMNILFPLEAECTEI